MHHVDTSFVLDLERACLSEPGTPKCQKVHSLGCASRISERLHGVKSCWRTAKLVNVATARAAISTHLRFGLCQHRTRNVLRDTGAIGCAKRSRDQAIDHPFRV